MSRGSQHLSLDSFTRLISDPLGHEDQEQQRLKGACLASRPPLMSGLERDQAARRQRLVPRPTAGPCRAQLGGAGQMLPRLHWSVQRCSEVLHSLHCSAQRYSGSATRPCIGQFRGAVEVLHGHALVSSEVQWKCCTAMHWSAQRCNKEGSPLT